MDTFGGNCRMNQCPQDLRLQRLAKIERRIVDHFVNNPYPSEQDLIKLARELGMSMKEMNQAIYNMFSNLLNRSYKY